MTDHTRALCRSFVPTIVAVVLLSACDGGGEPTPANQNASLPPASVTSSPSASPTPTATVDRYPNLARFSDPLDRFTYKYAYDDCGISTAEELAETYGGDARDLASVARAYASFSSGWSRQARFLGCLDALKADEESEG